MTDTTRNGIPKLGLGTFGRTGEEGLEALIEALEVGYRHIDTAQSYGTEENVGEALRRSSLPRDEVFVTTKVADTNLAEGDFLPSVERSRDALGLETIDLLLIHWPLKDASVPIESYLEALADVQQRGWAERIGVSNFPVILLERATEILGPDRLATDQVELHPYLQSPRLRDHAASTGLPLTAYMPLAKGRVSEDATLAEIARRHDSTPAAVSLAFLMQEGHVVIPASSNPQRLRENFAAAELTLDPGEISTIRTLDRGDRIIDPEKAPVWDD